MTEIFDVERVAAIREAATRWMSDPDEVVSVPDATTIPAAPDDVFWLLNALEAARELAVEADAFISHMLYRGSWPGERQDVERLIGRLRPASKVRA